jgi:hypothetical protein
MRSPRSRLVWGATLFTTPGLKSDGVHFPVLLTVVVAVIAVGVVMALIQRSWRPRPPDPDPGDGWGKRSDDPPPNLPFGPRGGVPLDDAVPARVRLRDARRLADRLPRPPRRVVREPDRRPVREKTPA